MKKILVVIVYMVLFTSPASAGNFFENLFSQKVTNHDVKKKHKNKNVSYSAHDMATTVAISHGVSPAVVHAIIKMESSGKCGADNGIAHGIMQVQTPTARSVGINGNLHDCRIGLEAGVRYLKKAIAIHGNSCAAYSSYNSGIYSNKCTSYGRKVMTLARV